MKQTVEEVASAYLQKILESTDFEVNFEEDNYDAGSRDAVFDVTERAFIAGAEWQSKQSPWISVKERLPEEGQRILVGFLYYYKYADREVESPKHIDIFTYENGWWIDDSDNFYRGKEVTEDDIKVICWQPIPSFDEILEANRDVLDRIKEKGD